MSINIYWACLEKEWMRAEQPNIVYLNFLQKNELQGLNIKYCPAVKSFTKNLYSLKSLYSYSFYVENNEVFSKKHDQIFFNKHVNIRDVNKKLFSFSQFFIFFTEEDSLEMEIFHPFLEQNNITEKCITIPGKFDIGKWFRNIDFAFLLKNNTNSFIIEENEIFLYLKFNTEKKINFVQFQMNDKLKKYSKNFLNTGSNSSTIRSLKTYYSLSKNKKKIIEEIKKNIV